MAQIWPKYQNGPKKWSQNGPIKKQKNPFFSLHEWGLNLNFQVDSSKNGRNKPPDRQTTKTGETVIPHRINYGVSTGIWCFNYVLMVVGEASSGLHFFYKNHFFDGE